MESKRRYDIHKMIGYKVIGVHVVVNMVKEDINKNTPIFGVEQKRPSLSTTTTQTNTPLLQSLEWA